MWEGTASNILKRCVEMDLFILSYKHKAKNYDDFLSITEESMKVTFPELFKFYYWDRDFEEEVLNRAKTVLSKNQYNVLFDVIIFKY